MADERESAIVVELPELDIVLDKYRRELDPSPGWGMPAHLTVLYPFVPPTDLNHNILSKLQTIATTVRPFEAEFDDFGWFADRVVWLAPPQSSQFGSLIREMMNAFPECPPYGGAFDKVVPHITIGESNEVDLLRAAEDAIRPQLPLKSMVTSLSLMEGSTAAGSWHVLKRVPLGSTRP
jgi:2'-5' RNA ligase